MTLVRVRDYANVGRRRLAATMDGAITVSRHADAAWSRLAARLNILSMDRPVKAGQEMLMLTVAPMLTIGLVCAATGLVGQTYRPGCNSFTNFMNNLLLRPEHQSTCVTVPFLSDIPTILLSVTCAFAMVAYHLLRRRLNWLVTAVSETGLVDTALAAEMTKGMQRLQAVVDLNRAKKLVFFAVTTVMTTWLYWRYMTYGKLFAILATTRHGVSNESELRASWWANYHYHPVLAALCIFIGSVGIYYALRAAWLYLMLGEILITSRKSKMAAPEFKYVPQWKDHSYGWSPVTGALFLIYVSTVNFAVSMIAVFDMLQGREWTIAVAAFFAGLGVLSNLIIVLVPLIKMLVAHRAVERRLRDDLVRQVATVNSPNSVLDYAIKATDLAAWRRIPVNSLSVSTLKIVPGVYAFMAFVVRVIFAKH